MAAIRAHLDPIQRPLLASRQGSGRPALRRPVQARQCSPRVFNSSRGKPSFVPEALAGGGAGNLGGGKDDGFGSGGGRGGGGGGGGDGQGGAGDSEQPGKKGFGWKGWQERVAYDPEYPFKVLLEQIIGVGASVVGDMSSRPNWGLNELDFVFATLVVGSIMNFSIMYLLAPTAAAGGAAAAGSKLSQIVSGEFLKAAGAPTGNMFQAGNFSVPGRLINFVGKGAIFGCLGFGAGIMGTSLSNGLLEIRKKMDPTFITQNEPPNVLGNAICWTAQMAVSANLRYQLLGGADQVLVKALPMPVFRVYSAGIRAANNIVGGMSFVTIARLFGVQKAPPAAVEA